MKILEAEYKTYTFLKVMNDEGQIIASIRGRIEDGNRHVFNEESVNWMQGIKCLKGCGASIEDIQELFFVKHFSLKKASKFPVFSTGISLLWAGTFMHPGA